MVLCLSGAVLFDLSRAAHADLRKDLARSVTVVGYVHSAMTQVGEDRCMLVQSSDVWHTPMRGSRRVYGLRTTNGCGWLRDACEGALRCTPLFVRDHRLVCDVCGITEDVEDKSEKATAHTSAGHLLKPHTPHLLHETSPLQSDPCSHPDGIVC